MSDVRWLLRFARPATAKLLGSIAARLGGHLLGALLLALPAWAVGMLAIGAASGLGFVVAVMAVYVGAALVKAGLRYLEQLLGHLAAFGLMGEMRVWMIDRLIPQSPAVTDGLGAARVHTTAVRDVDRVEVFFAHTIAPAVTAVAIPVAAVTVAGLSAGWLPALVLAGVLALGILVPLAGARAGRAAARGVVEVRADLAQHLADTLRCRDEVLAFDATAQRLDGAGRLDDRLATALRRAGRRAGLRHAVNAARLWLGALAVILAGAPEILADPDALPGVLLAAAFVPGTANALDSIERLAGSLPAGLEATRRIRELAAGRPAVVEPAEPAPMAAEIVPAEAPALELRDVRFAYPGQPAPTLDGIDLAVPSGAMLGIVGATGSGKSTIARLAQRHWDATSGEVLVHGVDVAALGSTAVQRIVAVADQDPFVLDATVAENLRLGDPEATDAELAWAAGVAELDVPLDAPSGRRGASLSGGQRQRLALARTLLRAAAAPGGLERALLVLDEATSHQDPLTQARVLANLRELGLTTLVIAHRLDTVRAADRIVVVERGRIVEAGDYDALAAADGPFAALLAAS